MPTHLRLENPDVLVSVHRSARARRLTLTVPRTGAPPRLTAPPHAADPELRMFLMRQADWLRSALECAPNPVPILPGAHLPVSGRMLLVEQREGRRRPPQIEGECLTLHGRGAPGARVAAWLKERARAAIIPIVAESAAAIGVTYGKISLRDTTGRWGSCTSRGDLSFSWRLAMAPPDVLDYVAVHEAAHLVEMNHGPRFWALVERLRPDWKRQRDWLRLEGPDLHLYRFDAVEKG